MADLDFFWDPVCPWAWLTSRWVVNVMEERPLSVDWRIAAAIRTDLGPDRVLDFYTAVGRALHLQKRHLEFDDPAGVTSILEQLGHPAALASVATDVTYDEIIREETALALERCGGNIGTPVLTFGPPDGPSFFGPVINRAPKGPEAVELWDAVVALGSNPNFSELKRSLRGRPVFAE